MARQEIGLELWGNAEIAGYMNVHPTSINRWRMHNQFPQPYVELAMGPVWLADDVRAWFSKRAIEKRAKQVF